MLLQLQLGRLQLALQKRCLVLQPELLRPVTRAAQSPVDNSARYPRMPVRRALPLALRTRWSVRKTVRAQEQAPVRVLLPRLSSARLRYAKPTTARLPFQPQSRVFRVLQD